MPATKRSATGRPYPGLRSFEASEASLFHGRERQIEELLRRLSQNRFLAVVGSSGSGKSSVVRAGLLPALYRGYLSGATTRWRIAVMHPGSAPLGELAKALARPDVFGNADIDQLRESSFGIVNAVRAASLANGESLLIVVDQFEELFRFRRESVDRDGGAEAALFVSQLLQASEEFGAAIYVVITMRSDFLGECAQFPGLPEALNKGQYLIPRMTREQRREAITASLDLFDASMSDRLVHRLLNDAGDDPDQLSVLQHALQQTYAIQYRHHLFRPRFSPRGAVFIRRIVFGDFVQYGP
jgi:energy-coupling factor transporter ATP-binding protein EcfA2